MRRPSWNKSQAIQQVIMLKALLEPTPDSDACRRKFYITHRQQETPTTRVQKGTSAELVAANGHQSDIPGDNDFVLHGISGVTNEANEQMTIIYSGKLNVYDDIPAEKAWMLLQLAASPLEFPQFDKNVTTNLVTYHLQAPNTTSAADLDFSARFLQMGEGCSASRKASIQRYREKRKDRFKSKKSGSRFNAYLRNQIQNQQSKLKSNRTNTPNGFT